MVKIVLLVCTMLLSDSSAVFWLMSFYIVQKSFAKYIGTVASSSVNQYFLSNMTYVTQKSILL